MKGEIETIDELLTFVTYQKTILLESLETKNLDTKKTPEENLMKPIFSDNVYNVLKWVVMILLPALGTGYFALGNIWNLPYPEQIVGTIVVITTFLGALLGVSTAQYNTINK